MPAGIKLHRLGPYTYAFRCPGCNHAHAVRVPGNPYYAGATWEWNESLTAPTFTPPILIVGEKRCQAFVEDGNIRFLADCHHALAGQTVPLPDWE